MRKILVALVGFLFIAVVSAQAGPITLQNGPAFITYSNLEQLDTSLSNSIDVPDSPTTTYGNAGNWGVFNISTIQAGAVATPHQDISGGPAYFFDDGVIDNFGMGQITGIFYDIQLTSGTTATSGKMDFYWHDAASDFVTAAMLSGGAPPNAATVTAFTSGTFLASLDFMPGIVTGDATTTLLSNIDVTNPIGNGKAEFFADVNLAKGGAWAEALDSNWFYVDTDGDGVFGEADERRDLRMASFFNLLSTWDDPSNSYVLGVRSNYPARGYAVPEPDSVILLGLGLLGLAGVGIRRSRK